jgi:16S rRNA processing protein RimM
VVGVIERLEHLPAQDLLVVRAGDREVLVPFVRAIVPEVDVERRRVVVTPPDGLFEELPDEAPRNPDASDVDEPESPDAVQADPVQGDAACADPSADRD